MRSKSGLARAVVTLLSAAAVLTVIAVGCGGSSGGGGGSPTEPPTVAQVAGNWTGTTTLQSATGCGCVSDAFSIFVGLPFAETAQISQNGSAIQGQIGQGADACDFTGTVGTQSLSATVSGCPDGTFPEIQDFECLNGNIRDLVLTGETIEATVSGDQINGTTVETVDCFHGTSGEPLGTMRLVASLALRRG
jgi:hypothetical protein